MKFCLMKALYEGDVNGLIQAQITLHFMLKSGCGPKKSKTRNITALCIKKSKRNGRERVRKIRTFLKLMIVIKLENGKHCCSFILKKILV